MVAPVWFRLAGGAPLVSERVWSESAIIGCEQTATVVAIAAAMAETKTTLTYGVRMRQGEKPADAELRRRVDIFPSPIWSVLRIGK